MKNLNKGTKGSRGITLIALIITIIVLIILAGISLSGVLSEKGIFSRTEQAGNKYNEAKARETLEAVLLADAQYEKHSNPEYDQDVFLNDLITKEIPGSEIKGDVVILGEYAYELDRSVPKIGRPLGKAEGLVFPTVEIVSGPTLINNGRKATFTAKATETTKGIKRIELWLNGKKIEKETINYETPQTEITVNFEVNRNGPYIIKAYADLMGSEKVKVEGIVPAISFSPNGSTTYKKEHTTKIIVEETGETIIGMKYLWVKDDGVNEPAETAFIEECPSNRIITCGNETMTGIYYLWVLLTVGTGENQKINICVSEGFYFDNEEPTITLKSDPVSEKSFTLTTTASDNKSGIARYEFYIDGEKVDIQTTTESTSTYTWNGTEMVENKECYVIVYDNAGNYILDSCNSRTLLFAWEKWTCSEKKSFETVEAKNWPTYGTYDFEQDTKITAYKDYTPISSDSTSAIVTLTGGNTWSLSTGYTYLVGKYVIGNYTGNWKVTDTPEGNGISFVYIKSMKKLQNDSKLRFNVEFTGYTYDTKVTYLKGNSLEETILTSRENAYLDNKRNSNGYWYISVGIR